MGNSKKTSAEGGISFCGLLAIAFIILKLCHVIDWSWWWVLAPLWIPAALGIVLLILMAVLMGFAFKRF